MESIGHTKNSKIHFYENAEDIVHSLEIKRHEPVSFYEGIAVFLSEGFLKSNFAEEPTFGYPAQKAA